MRPEHRVREMKAWAANQVHARMENFINFRWDEMEARKANFGRRLH